MSVCNDRLKEIAELYHVARTPRLRKLPPVRELTVSEARAMARELLELRATIEHYKAEDYDRQMGADA